MFVYCVLQSCSSRSFVSFVKVYTISNVWGPFLLRLFPHLFSYLYQYTLSQIVIFVNTHCYKRSCSQTRRKEIICCKYRRMTGGRLGTYSPQVLCKMTIYICVNNGSLSCFCKTTYNNLKKISNSCLPSWNVYYREWNESKRHHCIYGINYLQPNNLVYVVIFSLKNIIEELKNTRAG